MSETERCCCIACPGRNADCQRKFSVFLILSNRIAHISLPGILGFHIDAHPGNAGRSKGSANIEMCIDGVCILSPCILGKRCNAPGHIRRAAGTRIPLRALRQHMLVSGNLAGHRRIHLQRIYIKESSSVMLHPA